MSVRRQCERVGRNRSTLYYQPTPETTESLEWMRLVDQTYTAHPFFGSRRVMHRLIGRGHEVNRKRVQRLMRVIGLEAIYPKPQRPPAGRGHKVHPYRLRDGTAERVNQVWSADITSVPLPGGLMYLAATIDGFSRYVVAWRLSNTLDGSFCQDMLDEALGRGTPEAFHTDPGVPLTAGAWTGRLESAGVAVGRDGRGRCVDSVFVERLWRGVKAERTTTANRRRRCRAGYNSGDRVPAGLARVGPLRPGVPRPHRRSRTMCDRPAPTTPPRA